MKTTTMKVAALEACDRVRVRQIAPKASTEVVLDYAEAYKCGLITEPLDVFRERGTERYIVADGENRLLALHSARIAEVEVRLHEGDELAALDFAIGCNQTHGLRRSKADKYHAFVRIMETELRNKYRTDTELSEKVGVSKRTIADYKVLWRNSESGDKATRRKKKRAAAAAEKNTNGNGGAREAIAPRPAAGRNGWDDATCIVVPPLISKEKSKTRGHDASEGLGWTDGDEESAAAIHAALSALGEAWKKASRAAQIHMADAIAKTTKGMR